MRRETLATPSRTTYCKEPVLPRSEPLLPHYLLHPESQLFSVLSSKGSSFPIGNGLPLWFNTLLAFSLLIEILEPQTAKI